MKRRLRTAVLAAGLAVACVGSEQRERSRIDAALADLRLAGRVFDVDVGFARNPSGVCDGVACARVEVIDGREVRDGTADLGRVQRQQKFLGAVFDEVGGTINPITLLRILDGVRGNIRVDDEMSFRDAISLALEIRGLSPEVATVPTRPITTSTGAAVLILRPEEAEAILVDYR